MQVPKKYYLHATPLGPPSFKKQNLPAKGSKEDTKESPAKDTGNAKKVPKKEDVYIIAATEQDRLLLARLIEAEAEAEPLAGKIAVGAVVVNRVLHPSFPSTVFEVIMEPDQFETVANQRLANIWTPNRECLEAAEQALRGTDPTNGALFFYNPHKTQNQWLRKKPVKLSLGSHLFVG